MRKGPAIPLEPPVRSASYRGVLEGTIRSSLSLVKTEHLAGLNLRPVPMAGGYRSSARHGA